MLMIVVINGPMVEIVVLVRVLRRGSWARHLPAKVQNLLLRDRKEGVKGLRNLELWLISLDELSAGNREGVLS